MLAFLAGRLFSTLVRVVILADTTIVEMMVESFIFPASIAATLSFVTVHQLLAGDAYGYIRPSSFIPDVPGSSVCS